MCGITGFFARDSTPSESLAILQRMTRALSHRGPDGEGYWQSADGLVNLGHRRLAVIDLSETGSQPMAIAAGAHVISYNGEIYNFPELREKLINLGANFRGTSDTEVLLNALLHWGVEPTLKRLNGMFAFAYWDSREHRLWLARDRFGEKPLYYAWQRGTFLFGSELKAFSQHPDFAGEVDRDVLPTYLRFNYVPWPYSIFKNVHQVPPGHFLEVDLRGEPQQPKAYWSLRDLIEARAVDRRAPDDPSLVNDLEQILSKAVRERMLADVPLGAFLSGGVDSSLVVALMQKQSARPVKTFTIGFWESDYNEAADAARVARHLGTEHHEYYLSSRECLDVIQRLPEIYNEPFADSSQIPTTLVSEFTKRHVTVALSGDAGDEMFGGYNRYAWSRRIWPLINSLPAGLRGVLRDAAHWLSPYEWDLFFSGLNPVLPAKLKVRSGGEKLHKLAAALGARDTDALYRSFVSQWIDPSQAITSRTEYPSLLDSAEACPRGLHYVEKMMFLDQMTYMPSDILCKVDRATMSTGLEARVPFLDNEITKFSWTLPMSTKLHRGISKWPLRQVLERYLPKHLFERPKAGFGVPVGDWLRGPLRDWAEDLLSEASLNTGGYFRTDVVRSQWLEHLSGRRNLQYSLWGILMFQAWQRHWGRNNKAATKI